MADGDAITGLRLSAPRRALLRLLDREQWENIGELARGYSPRALRDAARALEAAGLIELKMQYRQELRPVPGTDYWKLQSVGRSCVLHGRLTVLGKAVSIFFAPELRSGRQLRWQRFERALAKQRIVLAPELIFRPYHRQAWSTRLEAMQGHS